MSAPEKTPSTETRVYSIIFRIRWCPFIKMCSRSRGSSRFWNLGRSRCCTRSRERCVCQWCLHLFISFQCLFVGAVPFSPYLREVSITFHRSEEHTSELQSHSDLVCRLLL